MTKKEFIRELREALDGIVPSSIVEENAAYYEGYFESQKIWERQRKRFVKN